MIEMAEASFNIPFFFCCLPFTQWLCLCVCALCIRIEKFPFFRWFRCTSQLHNIHEQNKSIVCRSKNFNTFSFDSLIFSSSTAANFSYLSLVPFSSRFRFLPLLHFSSRSSRVRNSSAIKNSRRGEKLLCESSVNVNKMSGDRRKYVFKMLNVYEVLTNSIRLKDVTNLRQQRDFNNNNYVTINTNNLFYPYLDWRWMDERDRGRGGSKKTVAVLAMATVLK